MNHITSLTRKINQIALPVFNYSKTYSTRKPEVIDYDEVFSGLKNHEICYIDVRNKDELKKDGQIVGSINIPLPKIRAFEESDEEFKTRFGFDKPKKESGTIVVGCLLNIRSLDAWKYLKSLGYNNVRIYNGGFIEWKSKEGPIF